MDSFTDLDVWKRGCRLCWSVYREVGDTQDWGFRDQITRADFVRFLRFAKASTAEVGTQLFIGSRIGLMDRDRCRELVEEGEEISKMLQGLITRLQGRV